MQTDSSRIAFRALLISVILAPLVFIPSVYIAQDLTKVLVIVIGTLVATVAYVYVSKKEGVLILPPRNLLILGLLTMVSVVVSAFLSSSISKSLFGQGFESGTASFILVLFIAAWISSVVASRHASRVVLMYLGIVGAFLVLYVFQVSRLIFGADFLSLSFLNTVTSTLLGNWYSFGTYSILVIIVASLALSILPLSRMMKTVYWVLVFCGVTAGILVNNSIAWQSAAIIFLIVSIVVSLSNFKKISDGIESSKISRIAWIPLSMFVLATLFYWKGSALFTPLIEKVGAQHFEISLPWQYTAQITSDTLKDDPLFGVGPNRFSHAYITYKPAEINLTSVWAAEFTSGFGYIPTFVTTQGFIGSIMWILFLISLVVLAKRTVGNLPVDPQGRFILISSITGAGFLWLMLFLSVPSHTLIFYTAVMTGLWIGATIFYGISKPTEYSLASTSGLSQKVIPVAAWVAIIVCVVWGGIYVKKATALTYFGLGIRELTVASDPDKAHAYFARSTSLDTSDIYWRAEAEAFLLKAGMIIRDTNALGSTSLSEETILAVGGAINAALDATKNAIAYDPSNYYNYISQARVFEGATSLKIDGSYESGLEAYTQAINLNPTNPALHLNLARFHASQNKLDDALQSAGAAVKMKGNYTDAVFLLSQIQSAKGNVADAITAAQVAIEIDPRTPLLQFQLGILYYNDKQYSNAATALAKAVQLQPDYANAQYFLGLSQYYLGQRANAIEQFEKLAVTNPDSQEVVLIIANLKAGRTPFTDARPPVTSTPEKRSTLPLKENEE